MADDPGDPRARPTDELCAITATGSIKRERDNLIGKTVVCSLNGNSHDSEIYHVTDTLTTQLDIPLDDMQVVKHHPEQYLILFEHRRDAQRVLNLPFLQNRGRTFHFAPWTEQKYAMPSALKFHVRLRIEGVPVHAWSEAVAAQVIGRHCAIHYVEEHSRRRQRTRTYDLWAWCTNPSAIAKKVWLTISDPDRELPSTDIPLPLVHIQHERPVGVKHGLTYKLLIHLDVLEDLTLPHGNRDRRIDFLWHYGFEDTMGRRRERVHGRQEGGDPPPRRDDEDHRRGTRRHRSQSAWGRVSRCRGMVDDCYSSMQRLRGKDSGHTPHRSRDATLPSWRGWGRGLYDDSIKRSKIEQAPQAATPKQCKMTKSKHVSFATPLFQYCTTEIGTRRTSTPTAPSPAPGPAPSSALLGPGGGPSMEDRILNMLEAATGWTIEQSPTGQMDIEQLEEGEILETTPHNNSPDRQHVEQPLTNLKMQAIKTLVEQGNRPKSKKRTRIAPVQQAIEVSAQEG